MLQYHFLEVSKIATSIMYQNTVYEYVSYH